MKKYFWKFLMRQVQDVTEAEKLGKKVLEQKLDYEIYRLQDGDYIFKIKRNGEQIFEFVCSPMISRIFLAEAINF